MQCSATIVQISGPEMRVEMDSAEICGSCVRSGGCGSNLLVDLFPHRPTTISVARLPGSVKGGRVRLEISDSVALPLAFIGFIVPVLLLLAGAMLAQSFFVVSSEAESYVALAGAGGFVGGLIAYKPLSGYVWSRAGTPVTVSGSLGLG